MTAHGPGLVDPADLRGFAVQVGSLAMNAPGEYRLALAEMELEALAEAYALEAAQTGSARSVQLTFNQAPSSGYPSIKDGQDASHGRPALDVHGASGVDGLEDRPHPRFVNFGTITPTSKADVERDARAKQDRRVRSAALQQEEERLAAENGQLNRLPQVEQDLVLDREFLAGVLDNSDDCSPSVAAPVLSTPDVVPMTVGDSADPEQATHSVASSPSAGGAGASSDASAPHSWVPAVTIPLSSLLASPPRRPGIAGFGIEARP
jgi:hypothetical protein